jgi:hypothetical protein
MFATICHCIAARFHCLRFTPPLHTWIAVTLRKNR